MERKLFPIKTQELDCDFMFFQDIKYVAQRAGTGKESWLNKLPAYQEVEK
jgi:hypothetical protein